MILLLLLVCVCASFLLVSGFSRPRLQRVSVWKPSSFSPKALQESSDIKSDSSDSSNNIEDSDDWDISEVQSRLLLAFVAATYGTNYAAIKELGELLDPSLVNVLRFAIAATVFSPVFLKNLSKTNIIKGGAEIGFWNSLGYLGQAFALNNGGKAGQVAFIGSLTVVICSILDYFFTSKENTSPRNAQSTIVTFLPSILSVAGVWLLSQEPVTILADIPVDSLVDTEAISSTVNSNGGGDNMSWTALATAFMQPICFGFGYFRQCRIVQRCSNKKEYQLLNSAAMMTVVTSSIMAFLALHHGIDGLVVSPSLERASMVKVVSLLLWTGAGTTAIAGLAESVAVKKLSASETTMIFGTEPLWGTFFGYILLQEQLSSSAGVGAGVILAAVGLSLYLEKSDDENGND
jgi:drug/metabolite transporter (DMT)-like permease